MWCLQRGELRVKNNVRGIGWCDVEGYWVDHGKSEVEMRKAISDDLCGLNAVAYSVSNVPGRSGSIYQRQFDFNLRRLIVCDLPSNAGRFAVAAAIWRRNDLAVSISLLARSCHTSGSIGSLTKDTGSLSIWSAENRSSIVKNSDLTPQYPK